MLVFFHLGEEESNFEQILWKEASCIVAKPLPRPLSVRFAKHPILGLKQHLTNIYIITEGLVNILIFWLFMAIISLNFCQFL